MSQPIILPFPNSLFVCEGCIGFSGKTDLVNIFNAIHPPGYPYLQKLFVVYARLSQGLGHIPFFVEIHLAKTQQLIHVTNTFTLNFPDRDKTVEMALNMPNIPFPQAGLYLVQLYLDNKWACECTLQLL